MTTNERIAVRKALLDAGFRRSNSSFDKGDGVYTETWNSSQDASVIQLTWDKKTKPKPKILGSVRFDGASSEQIRWGTGNADPNKVLTVGTLYDVVNIEVH